MSRLSPVGASLATMGRADLALYGGRAADAQAALGPAIAVDLAAKRNTPAALKQIALAEALMAAGKTPQAIKAANDGLAISRQTATLVPAARLFVRAGRAADAKAIAAELEKSLNKQTRAYGRIVLAENEIAANDTARAIDLLDQAKALADVWLGRFDRGVAYVQAGHFAEAVAELDASLKRRGEATSLFFDDVPTVRYLATLPYWIGRAQDGLNITASAQTHYQEFLTIKKDAAPDPLVQDARRRVK
jgi:tetratricopeptide (TPR) repeat protein